MRENIKKIKNMKKENVMILMGIYMKEILNLDNKKEGKGIMYYSNGKINCEGDFVNDYIEKQIP